MIFETICDLDVAASPTIDINKFDGTVYEIDLVTAVGPDAAEMPNNNAKTATLKQHYVFKHGTTSYFFLLNKQHTLYLILNAFAIFEK